MTSPYGAEHQAIRLRLLASLVDGTPCPRCGLPMYRADAALLDAGHPLGFGLKESGGSSKADHLEHRACNRGARGAVGRRPATSQDW